MSESDITKAKKGDLILVHHDTPSGKSKSLSVHNRPTDLLLVWDTSQSPTTPTSRGSFAKPQAVAGGSRAVSLTDLLPRQSQRQTLNMIRDPDEFWRLLKEVVIDPLFRLKGSFEPLAKPLKELVAETDCVFLRPSNWAVRKVWLDDTCC